MKKKTSNAEGTPAVAVQRCVSLRRKHKDKVLCPTCRQDMMQPPRDGTSKKDCPQCGQGLSKQTAIRLHLMRAG